MYLVSDDIVGYALQQARHERKVDDRGAIVVAYEQDE